MSCVIFLFPAFTHLYFWVKTINYTNTMEKRRLGRVDRSSITCRSKIQKHLDNSQLETVQKTSKMDLVKTSEGKPRFHTSVLNKLTFPLRHRDLIVGIAYFITTLTSTINDSLCVHIADIGNSDIGNSSSNPESSSSTTKQQILDYYTDNNSHNLSNLHLSPSDRKKFLDTLRRAKVTVKPVKDTGSESNSNPNSISANATL